MFVPEIKTATVKAWFATCSDPIVSADWLVTEFASALSFKERRRDVSAEQAQAVWLEFRSFSGTGVHLVPASREAFEEAARMARDAASGLRAGDAVHLAVALGLGAPALATADAVLDVNARKRGLETVRF